MSAHVHTMLTAHLDGELEPDESRRVAEHLIGCERCRRTYEDLRFAASLVARLPEVEPPPGLWDEIASAASVRPTRALPHWRRYAAAAAVALAALGAVAVWLATRAPGPSWQVSALGGAPRVGTTEVRADGRIAVGDALVTDAASRAEIRVGAIGTVDVEPNSRVRLVEASVTEHRLALDRGTLKARIWAPPRLFFVDTPAGVAVDYGCAYTLTVDDGGAGLLRVTLGEVALELGGRESLVPAGAACATRPGLGPGTPFFEDAPDALRAALARYDFEGGGAPALGDVLASARPRDTLTLWYLLARTTPTERPSVYDRLAALAPPPGGVDRDAVLALDAEALARWRERLEAEW